MVEFNIFGKAKKDGKTKTVFVKKTIYDTIVVSFNFFASFLLRSVETSVLMKLRYTVQHCLMEFKFDDYSAYFFSRRYFIKVRRIFC